MFKVTEDFSKELKKYGADNFDACYNCGNCTAVCSLSEENANFPRMFIRYGILGQKEEILTSKELWLCYACGDCTETCPRTANPGDYMSALRRYAIARYDMTGLTGLLFKNNFFAIIFTFLLAIVIGFFLLTIRPEHQVSRWIFDYMPFQVIHDFGLIVLIITVFAAVAGALKMFFKLYKKEKANGNTNGRGNLIQSVKRVFHELVTTKRYQDCDKEEDSYWFNKPFFLKPWFVHWTIMWGFIGLLIATTLDFIFKDPATDIWLPGRILGTLAGMLMVYGATVSIVYRFLKITKTYTDTKLADAMFLGFLWLAGITGFWMEAAVTFHANNLMSQWVFIVHTIISMELIILFAFSKFAHVLYRPIALFIHYYYR